MFDYKDYKVLLACGAVDMRKSINGLCEIVMNEFELDPREKILFGFCNKQRNRIKILVWDDNGFWIHFKISSMITKWVEVVIMPRSF